jgi:hypothetical protein
MWRDPQGEHIARATAGSNDWDRHGAKTLEGLPGLAFWFADRWRAGQPGADRNSEVRAGSGPRSRFAKHAGGGRVETRFKAFGSKPWKGESPREYPVPRVVNRAVRNEGLSEGSKPGSRRDPGRPEGFAPKEQTDRQRHAGPPWGVMVPGTFREGKAPKGVTNPKSAVGTKQGRPGLEGRKPSGG